MVNAKIEINNIPDYVFDKDYNYWLTKYVDGELWFFGAYDTEKEVNEAKSSLDNGLVICEPII